METLKKWQKKATVGMLYVLAVLAAGFTIQKKAETLEGGTQMADSKEIEDSEKKSAYKEIKKVALTFDDGPHPYYTEMLLDGLKERNVKATFFLIGDYVKAAPDIVKRIKEEGHSIGNHTMHHVKLTDLSREDARRELEETNKAIEDACGEKVEQMRPPFGEWQKNLEEETGMFPVLWTVDPRDWATKDVEEIVNRVVTSVGENDIILLHDCYKTSVEAAFRIVDRLLEDGYEFVTAEELLAG